MITIKEIAKQLQVSTTTVSNVIHGKTSEVSPATVEKVQRYLDEVHYVPNISARNLAQNHSKIIGVVLIRQYYQHVNIFTDPFVAQLIGTIENAVRQKGYFMMLYISDNVEDIIRYTSSWNVDGLILFALDDANARKITGRCGKPLVFIDTTVEGKLDGNQQYVNIGLDDEAAAHDAIRYLIGRGHRRIAFLSRNMLGADQPRFQGYLRAMREAGLPAGREDILQRFSTVDEKYLSDQELCARARSYSAIFCCSDTSAIELINALERDGVHVPSDVSVVGFDDNADCHLARPALTTVSQDIDSKAKTAVRILMDMLRGRKPAEHEVTLGTKLIERESVRSVG